ncbi:MAG: hypothetical protein J6T34_01020 [Bacilli bacterium]|nr:hypothetical protein [Bacilli bacterium]
MITYVDNSNAIKYTVLFEQATQDLVAAQIQADNNGESGFSYTYQKDENNQPYVDPNTGLYVADDPITTIEKYFAYLKYLVELEDANSSDNRKVLHSLGRRYTMLPLDETPFEIDANSRKITIPSNFSANGVAVQGDQLAEVLYFRIDRYFDAKDLDDAEIFIQWETADGTTGLSAPIVIDIMSEPNKIIFGWALSEALTKTPGNIKFAVRFYKWANEAMTKLSYSWASQTVSVAVKETLDYTLSDVVLQQIARDMKDENELMIARIKSSETTVTDNEEAAFPVYVLNLRDDVNMVNDLANNNILYIDLDETIVQDEVVLEYPLKVQARSADGGIISYVWHYESLDHNTAAQGQTMGSDSDPSHSKDIKIKYELTQDETPKEKVYYEQKTVNDVVGYFAFDVAGLAPNETPVSKGLYEKFAYCTITHVGYFWVEAINSRTKANSKSKESDHVMVPMPSDPQITTNVVEREILPMIVDNKVTLTVAVINPEENRTRPGAITYQWAMKNNESDEWTDIDRATNASLDITYLADTVSTDVEGFYRVTVFNTKNGETVSVDSAVCRVSFEATEPQIVFPATAEDQRINIDAPNHTLHVELGPDWVEPTKVWNISDEITYQWYLEDDDDTVADLGDVIIEGATEPTYTPTAQGRYFCVVTNHKNGTEKASMSLVFFVA